MSQRKNETLGSRNYDFCVRPVARQKFIRSKKGSVRRRKGLA